MTDDAPSPSHAGRRDTFSATMADAVPILIGYVDADRRYRFVNRAYETWFGVRREDIEGRSLLEVMGADAYERVRDHVDGALEGQSLTFEGEVPYQAAGLRHVEAKYVPDVAPGGEVLGYYVLVTDISARKRAEAELARLLVRERRRALMLDLGRQLREESEVAAIADKACAVLAAQLGAQRAGYAEVDLAGVSTQIIGEWGGEGVQPLVGPLFVLDDFGPAMSDDLRAGVQVVIDDVREDARTRHSLEAYVALDIRAFVAVPLVKAGRLVSYLFVCQERPRTWGVDEAAFVGDVAELIWAASGRARADAALRQAEETERLLIREVDHRAKNVLAVVQSLVQLTPFVDKRQYVTALSGRIGSLARSHSLLSTTRWTGAVLRALLEQELEAYSVEHESRVVLDGPPVLIRAEAAQSLGLVVHELATNASKYGALSTPGGVLEVAWSWDAGRLVVDWRESGGPPAIAPARRGFGSTLIQNAGKQLGAQVSHDWRAEGLHCRIELSRGALPHAGGGERSAATTSPLPDGGLQDQRVLVVEDEALVAMELARVLALAGAQVVGPAGDVEEALELIESSLIDRAVLDVNLGGRMVTPVARALAERAIPFVYLTGYQEPGLDDGPVLHKPAAPEALVSALAGRRVERV
ncbi:PAS domain-containing protein [Caulobacter sp. 602-2]|uniref:histidine kinase n=1 Tax=Caulobacter sp. 602-2 TaxID=2710887 RepID=A0A6G4R412_9CAUL|nr:HWE histidine kinase domain-containing protein [Caulobacter sp. 602-2]NGM52532.1 PAS domain-containing protein [Caulobacter sp. 602-2]